jgi:hypothetical protein
VTTTELAPPQFPHDFPLRENCNPDDPYQAFLWMLVAWPGQNGGQLVMPVTYLQLVSKRLWDLGCRPVEAPILKYRKPGNLDPHWLTSPGSWVPIDAPDDDPRSPARKAADTLAATQKAELLRELAKDLTPKQRYDLARAMAEEGGGDDPA